MATARGAEAVRADRRGYTHLHWVNWSPPGWLKEAAFDHVARSFDNTDWVEVTLHSYRARWGEAEPDPRSAWLEDKIKATKTLSLPTLYIHGDADGVNPPSTANDVHTKFVGPFARITMTEVGHFPQRENPQAVVRHLLTLFDGNPAALTDVTDRNLSMKKAAPYAAGIAAIGLVAAAAAGVAHAQGRSAQLTQVAQFDHQATGVAVTEDGRRFVNFPRWTDDAPISVAEVMKDGSLRPYPDAKWNSWRNARANELPVGEYFVCVQSIVPDGHGNLWVLDPGAPGNEKILEGAPKLVRIDLASNTVTKTILVPGDVALQGTYLNDIRFSPDGKTGYITDSGTRGAIIVVDLESGKSHRALDGHASTQIDKTVKVTLDGKPLVRPDGRQPAFAADGIAISKDGKTLYYQALTGKTLYSIDTAKLRPDVSGADRAAAVKTVAQTHVADGLWMSKAGVLYLTSPTDYAIKRLNGATVETVLTDRRLRWPDTLLRRTRRDDVRHRQPHPGHQLVHARRTAVDQDAAVLLRSRQVIGLPMTYLRYSPDIETPEHDEQESIDGIIQGMTQESQTVEKRDGHAVRASHAKSTACVIGKLIVAPGLPPELAQGLFAEPGTFDVAVRFAQGPGEKLGDRVSTHRGMSIKVFGVEGAKLPGHDAPTQDFVLASGTTFPAGTPPASSPRPRRSA